MVEMRVQHKQLSEIDNRQLLQELKERIKASKIKEKEVATILAKAEAEA
jgi:hypothetical protein